MSVTIKYSMWIPKDVNWWVHGLSGYLPNLEVKNGDGMTLPILSDHELDTFIKSKSPDMLGIKKTVVDQKTLSDLCKEQIASDIKKYATGGFDSQPQDNTIRHYVVILLPNRGNNYFDDITINWVEKIGKPESSKDQFSKFVEREPTVLYTTTNSTYIDVTMDDKYEMIGTPTVTKVSNEGKNEPAIDPDDYTEMLNDKKRCVYRIRRKRTYPISIKCKIGIPMMVRTWAWAGLVLSGFVIPFVLASFSLDILPFHYGIGMLAGLMGLIIGFRVLLFHDIDLMIRWNALYVVLLVASMTAMVLMAILVYFGAHSVVELEHMGYITS